MRANWQSKNQPFFLMKKKWARYKKNKKMGAWWAHDGHNKNFQNITHQLKSAKKCAHRAKMCVFFFSRRKMGWWLARWKAPFFFNGRSQKKEGICPFLEIGILALSSYIAYWGLRGLIKKRKMVTRHLVFDKYSW